MHPAEIVQEPAYRSTSRPVANMGTREGMVEVVVTWGDDDTLAVAHLRPGERFALVSRGSTNADALRFVHPAMERGTHCLVERRGHECHVTPPPGATSAVAGLAAPVATEGPSFVLPRGAIARVEHGGVQYMVRYVPAAEKLPARRGDRLFGAAVMVALAGTIAAGDALRGVDEDGRLTRDDEEERRGFLIEHGLRALSYAPTHAEGTGPAEGGTGLRAIGDEGAAGLRRTPRVSRTWSAPPRRGPSRDEVVTSARERVLNRGVFSALGAPGAGPWGALTGDGGERRATGAMYGDAPGDARGYEGLGLLGMGWGGGRGGDGLIGLGRMPTRGHGTADGTGQGIGSGSYCGCGEGMLVSHRTGAGMPGVRMGAGLPHGCSGDGNGPCVSAGGALLSAEAIRRVVVRNLGQVRRCYETALAEVPTAEGRVAVRWVIGGEGAVLASTVTDNGTGSAGLGECVANAVRRWQFPAPEGGGVVTVNYPFDLSVVDP